MSKLARNIKTRFLNLILRIPFHECWEWNGTRLPKGYGQFGLIENGKPIPRLAHRVSYDIFVGKIPHGKHVLHTCDNPGCVRPDHLFVGTNMDNVIDKISKGRQLRGARHGQSKLTERQVRKIKGMLAAGTMYKDIAPLFKISASAVGTIARNETWKHV